MAKTRPLKASGSQSIHSRAAKRASSPSINTDKSLKNVKLPVESSDFRPSVLAVQHGAGITKKPQKGRKSVLSAKAKRRQEKVADRAEVVMDKKATRVEKSKGRAKTAQERSKGWEELNRRLVTKKAEEAAKVLEQENWVDEDDEVNDKEMEIAIPKRVGDLHFGDSNILDRNPSLSNTYVVAEDDAEEIL